MSEGQEHMHDQQIFVCCLDEIQVNLAHADSSRCRGLRDHSEEQLLLNTLLDTLDTKLARSCGRPSISRPSKAHAQCE